MADERLREIERRAKLTNASLDDWAAFIKEADRTGGESGATEALTSVQSDMRSQVLALTDIEEDRRPVMEVMARMQEQVKDSLTSLRWMKKMKKRKTPLLKRPRR